MPALLLQPLNGLAAISVLLQILPPHQPQPVTTGAQPRKLANPAIYILHQTLPPSKTPTAALAIPFVVFKINLPTQARLVSHSFPRCAWECIPKPVTLNKTCHPELDSGSQPTGTVSKPHCHPELDSGSHLTNTVFFYNMRF